MARSLRIALVAPPWFTVPPRGYGGIERVVAYLADGLAERGHCVTLFAPGGSVSAARVHSTYAEPQAPKLGSAVVEATHLVDAFAAWREFDIFHDHTSLGLLAGAALPVPLVHTIHGPVTAEHAAFYSALAARAAFVAISKSQARALPPGFTPTVIHNALDVNARPFGHEPGDYLLFVGRMCPEKGVLNALEIARRARLPLLLIAKINEAAEAAYFDEVVRPALAGVDVEFRRDASQAELDSAYQNALATVFPIEWEEPFGLVMIESMAAGTPVVAFNRGSVPEVVIDGETGFVCSGVDEAVGAVTRVRSLDRTRCRKYVAEHFSVARAVEAHEQLYRALVGAGEPSLARID